MHFNSVRNTSCSVISEGFGETKPKDPREKSKNRRVEIVVVTR